MGCDFYTYYVLHIKLSDNTIHEHKLDDTLERHYWTEYPQIDEDFCDAMEYHRLSQECYDRQIERELAQYKKRDLYKDNKWLCIEYSINKYKDILSKLKISENDIVHIWKEGGAELR